MKMFLSLCLFFASSVTAADYNYTSPERMQDIMLAGQPLLIVDIQVEEEFKQHRLQGSLATFAYPVKSEVDRAKLAEALKKQQQTGDPVVIVCPRGKGGAKRTYDYLKANGVESSKLSILEKGMAGWPYKELMEKG